MDTEENQNKKKYRGLTLFNWLLIAFIFVLGAICLLMSQLPIFGDYKNLSLILNMVGGFLIVAIPLELLREFFFTEANLSSFENRVEQLFDKKIDGALLQARKFGLQRIEDSLPVTKLFTSLKAGDTLWWLMTFCPGHKMWIKHVEEAVAAGAVINMLIPAPDSPLCALRAEEITEDYYSVERFNKDLTTFIEDFLECQKVVTRSTNTGGSLNFAFYNDLHGIPCYVVTRGGQPVYAYSSMYLTKPTGVGFPHFHWHQGLVADNIYEYVKNKYNKYTNKTNIISDTCNDKQFQMSIIPPIDLTKQPTVTT
jgi:hypothetical protein